VEQNPMNGRRLLAEFIGTAMLLAAIVGSGIVVSVEGPAPTQLFQHAVIVGAVLAAMILTFGSVSGAHFNPSVTIANAVFGGQSWGLAAGYVTAQIAGAIVGVGATNWIFGEPAWAIAAVERSGLLLVASEAMATFGLVVVIFGTVRSSSLSAVAGAVGSYIAAAIFFTASAAFANPAVTIARLFTDTWSGISPGGVRSFLVGQVIGTAVAIAVIGYLFPSTDVEGPAERTRKGET
jgi:glycerol uptake facilitator-like aquaporin